MASAVQSIEAREARADFVRAALRVLDAFDSLGDRNDVIRVEPPHTVLETRFPDLYEDLRELEAARSRWRMYALPDEMVRP